MIYLLGVSAGILAGAIFWFRYYKMDNIFVDLFSAAGPIGGSVYFVLKFAPDIDMLTFITVYITSFLVALVVGIFVTMKLLNSQEANVKITAFHILFQNKKSIEDIQQFYIDKEKLTKEKQQLEDDRNALKKEQALVQTTKKSLRTQQEEITNDKLCLNMPINKDVRLTERFVQQIPSAVQSLTKFTMQLTAIEQDTIKSLDNPDIVHDIDGKREIFKSYLFKICKMTAESFFTVNQVRVDIRIIDSNSKYKKYIGCANNQLCSQTIKPRSHTEGLIGVAVGNSLPVIKSLNSREHVAGSNDNKWRDYMVVPFSNFDFSITPFVMTISLRNEYQHDAQLQFLSYIGFHQYISDSLQKIISNLDVFTMMNIDTKIIA